MSGENETEGEDLSMQPFKIPFLPLDAPQAPTPPAFLLPLYEHQQRSLFRMLQIESVCALPAPRPQYGVHVAQPSDVPYNKFNFGHLDYYAKGGCLADAIGMGKTAVVLSLIVSEPRSKDVGANVIVAPSHLIEQWGTEINKFVRPGEVDVIKGITRYLNSDDSTITNRTIVLVSVEEVLGSHRYHYDWRKIYDFDTGRRIKVSDEVIQKYRKSACYVNGGYSGPVWTTKLHFPAKPFRRLVFEEVQDLVHDGKASQDCFIQLSRAATNVWLMTATPFPMKSESVYANNQLLGFKRLRMNCDGNSALPSTHPFEEIKRKLYLRNSFTAKAAAVTDKIVLREEMKTVTLRSAEILLYETDKIEALEKVRTIRNELGEELQPVWSKEFHSMRQLATHHAASERIITRVEQGSYLPMKQKIELTAISAEVLCVREGRAVEQEIRNQRVRLEVLKKVQKATQTSIDVVRGILSQGTYSVTRCFQEAEKCGIKAILSDPGCVFRIVSSHVDSFDTTVQMYPNPEDCIIEGWDEIEHYLANRYPTYDEQMHFLGVMETNLQHASTRVAECVHRIGLLSNLVALRAKLEVSTAGSSTKQQSSKVASIIDYLRSLGKKQDRLKVVMFSMWPEVLNVLELALGNASFTVARFNGVGRTHNLIDFTSGNAEILLLSSLSNASGINLQIAQYAIFVDPPGYTASHGAALEQQAMGRVLRMGQTQDVTVVRFQADATCEQALYKAVSASTAKAREAETLLESQSEYVCEGYKTPMNSEKSKRMRPEPKHEPEDDGMGVIELVSIESASERALKRMKKAEEERSDLFFDLTQADDNDMPYIPDANIPAIRKVGGPVMVKVEPGLVDAPGKKDVKVDQLQVENVIPAFDQQWKPDEDEFLIFVVGQYGRKWTHIMRRHGEQFPNRGPTDLKRRFDRLQRDRETVP